MVSRPNGPSSETDREADHAWRDTGPHEADRSQTSVPEREPSEQSKTRTLGPGSLGGTLCADPELRFTQNGKSLCKVRIAVQDRTLDPGSSKWVDGPAQYIDITCWGGQAERVTEALQKGDRVVVNGIWQESQWKGRDGEWHTSKSMTARDIGPSLMFRGARVLRGKEGS